MLRTALVCAGFALMMSIASAAQASSHMDAPLITFDDAANTTDVYAFVSERDGRKYLSTALAVYPFEEPGIGPNKHVFDDEVRYEIHVAVGDDVAKGRPTYSYRFEFDTKFRNRDTILQSYTGVIDEVGGEGQNLVQEYWVTRVDHRHTGKKKGSKPRTRMLGDGIVPPNNQGRVTPFYNQGNDGDQPARGGVANPADLDRYTQQSISELKDGHLAFAGQRDDGFYADIQAVFDLLAFKTGDDSFDSQGGFNVHTIALDIPVDQLGGDLQQVGVWATTSRRKLELRTATGNFDFGEWVQVARQGNPLFNEALVAIRDKDLYSRTGPHLDHELFQKYAKRPELARLIGLPESLQENRSDLVGIFIPDLIKVDLSTGRARLAGDGTSDPSSPNPDDDGFSRLGIFGGDVLISQISSGFGDGVVPGGWPNGRRFGDDVLDIAVSAVLSDLRQAGMVPISELPITVADGIDNVSKNDIAYNKVFPYAATPLNGRRHGHH